MLMFFKTFLFKIMGVLFNHELLNPTLIIELFAFHYRIDKRSRPSCSKLTTSLVNDSLKFTSSDRQIC